jgi:hypothetical protein
VKKNNWIFLLYFVLIILLGIIHFSKDPDFTWIHLAIHVPAIIGVVSIFFAILVTLLKKNILKTSIVSVTNLHHFFSYVGWSCILIHMIFLYVLIRKVTLFIPSFTSWNTILGKSGPIAILLILLGSLGFFFMKRWKIFLTLHSMNIIAFFWITVHGIFKDKALAKNIPYVIFLVALDLIVFVILIYNYFKHRARIS